MKRREESSERGRDASKLPITHEYQPMHPLPGLSGVGICRPSFPRMREARGWGVLRQAQDERIVGLPTSVNSPGGEGEDPAPRHPSIHHPTPTVTPAEAGAQRGKGGGRSYAPPSGRGGGSIPCSRSRSSKSLRAWSSDARPVSASSRARRSDANCRSDSSSACRVS